MATLADLYAQLISDSGGGGLKLFRDPGKNASFGRTLVSNIPGSGLFGGGSPDDKDLHSQINAAIKLLKQDTGGTRAEAKTSLKDVLKRQQTVNKATGGSGKVDLNAVLQAAGEGVATKKAEQTATTNTTALNQYRTNVLDPLIQEMLKQRLAEADIYETAMNDRISKITDPNRQNLAATLMSTLAQQMRMQAQSQASNFYNPDGMLAQILGEFNQGQAQIGRQLQQPGTTSNTNSDFLTSILSGAAGKTPGLSAQSGY